MLEKKRTWCLVVATVFYLLISVLTTPNKDYAFLISSLSVGFVVSSMFYFILVWLPDWKKITYSS